MSSEIYALSKSNTKGGFYLIYTDNKDFYPTPKALFERLLNGKRYLDGRILEPSAGKGDMIHYIKERMGRRERYPIDAIENDPRLVSTLMGEGYNVVWDDFLTYETYKEYDYIVMNPPFSNGVDHVLRALELAENHLNRCEIYTILNKETINNAYSTKRQELLRKLDEHGAEIQYVSEAFSDAERKTDVEVALIHANVEKDGRGRSIYDSIPFFSSQGSDDGRAIETALSTHVKASEVADRLNDIERLVAEYETACELARDTYEAVTAKQSFYSYINEVNKREGEVGGEFSHVVSMDKTFRAEDLNDELDRLRRGYWALILDTDDFRGLLTNEAIQKLNRQIEAANEMEINLANIRMLLTALGANQRDILTESIVSIFEKITRYHMNEYSTNIHYYDGWKTNDAYRINKKIIIPIKSEFDRWDFGTRAGSSEVSYDYVCSDVKNWIGDIIKAFKLIDSTVSDEFEAISDKEFENDTLRFRMFLNGNIHVWFKDVRLLEKLNYLCGQYFAWIPSEGEQETDEEARRWVAKEFGDIGEVELLQRGEGD